MHAPAVSLPPQLLVDTSEALLAAVCSTPPVQPGAAHAAYRLLHVLLHVVHLRARQYTPLCRAVAMSAALRCAELALAVGGWPSCFGVHILADVARRVVSEAAGGAVAGPLAGSAMDAKVQLQAARLLCSALQVRPGRDAGAGDVPLGGQDGGRQEGSM